VSNVVITTVCTIPVRHEVSNKVSVDGQTVAVYTDVDKSVFSNEVTADRDTARGILNKSDAYILLQEP
jgi:hypothetical protein